MCVCVCVLKVASECVTGRDYDELMQVRSTPPPPTTTTTTTGAAQCMYVCVLSLFVHELALFPCLNDLTKETDDDVLYIRFNFIVVLLC